ncbi:hypothetical protein UFOVP9_61 [uncultured Caudovirales phage]|jgi:hypothetical protein|uniref:Uncharacterized protein n=1 Tax=uncultured Caudovirales phage TaxID=2100421 RepID=A0A6J5KIG4_9CAUD|nr:hypothetical protein UFOVP9_61 [uncultured Caudovirales phage]
MAINALGYNQVYGITNGIQPVLKLPIIEAFRAPTSLDVAQQGQLWIYDQNVWMFVGGGVWSEIAASDSAGTFTSLTVNGNSAFNGAIVADTDNNVITLNSGTAAINISSDAFATTVNLGTGSAAKTVSIGSSSGASSTSLNAGTGGLVLNTNATGDILLTPNVVDGVSYTFTQNARVGVQSIVVPSGGIIATGTISIVMTNSYLSDALSTPVICTVTTNSTAGGLLQINGMIIGSDTLTISATNVGTATIPASTSNIIVSYIVLN